MNKQQLENKLIRTITKVPGFVKLFHKVTELEENLKAGIDLPWEEVK